MEIKADQLEKDIEAIPGVCDDAKRAIKKLFENNFGVDFKKKEVLLANHRNKGMVFKTVWGYSVLVFCGSFSLCSLDGYDLGHYSAELKNNEDILAHEGVLCFSAKSPEEYFRNKFNGNT